MTSSSQHSATPAAVLRLEAVNLINAIPYLLAALIMLVVGQHSDRTGERRWHVAVAAFAPVLGFALSSYFKNPYLAMASLSLVFAGLGPFWALGTGFLTGTAAAGAIALINSVGNPGGFFGPTLVGVIKDRTRSNFAARLLLGGALLWMGVLALSIQTPPTTRRSLASDR